MPKHRSNVFTVVRERAQEEDFGGYYWVVDAVIGTYATIMRAEEVAGAAMQAFIDAGASEDDYCFTVHINTWYDE